MLMSALLHQQSEWIERSVVVKNQHGIHANPAAKITSLASLFESEIEVAASAVQEYVTVRSMMPIMCLTLSCGTEVTFRARGTDADAALKVLVDLIAAEFYEKDGYGKFQEVRLTISNEIDEKIHRK